MMFAGNEKNKPYIKLVFRVVVAGYIGFLGGQLIYKRPPDSSPWFIVAAVFFVLVAVAFIIFSIIMFFKEKAMLAENPDENNTDVKEEVVSTKPDKPSGSFSISDMAKYKSSDVIGEENDAGSDNNGSVD